DLRPLTAAMLMVAALAVSFGLRRANVKSFWPYVTVGGLLSWNALHSGGLHAALALVPIIPFLPHAARDAGLFVEVPGARDSLNRFEHTFKYPVQAVLLLVGLANA